ncbi:MAG: hypothetical protein ABIJ34_01780 [archaeon]
MGKRGASEIDWIMSLSIFLLYVGWFFAFILPNISIATNQKSIITFLEDDFSGAFKWHLYKFPVFIFSNITGEHIPIIIDYSSNRTDLKFANDIPLAIWNGKLIFMLNISSDTETQWLLNGGSFEQSYMGEGLDIEPETASTYNMSVSFENSLPVGATYKSKERIKRISYIINTITFIPVNASYANLGFAGAYTARSGNINYTSIVFDRNTAIFNYLTFQENPEYSLSINMNLDDYDSYYTDNLYFGDFDYDNSTKNVIYSADHVTLYGKDSLSLYFQDNVLFNFTYYNQTLKLNADIAVSDNYEYSMIFHEGDYKNASRYNYYTEFGAVSTVEGLDFDNIITDYDSLKSLWELDNNFAILVYDNSSAYTYLYEPKYQIGKFNPGGKPVYADTVDYYALGADGTLSPVSVNYRIW